MPNEAVEKPQKHSPLQPPRRFFEEARQVLWHGYSGHIEVAVAIL